MYCIFNIYQQFEVNPTQIYLKTIDEEIFKCFVSLFTHIVHFSRNLLKGSDIIVDIAKVSCNYGLPFNFVVIMLIIRR